MYEAELSVRNSSSVKFKELQFWKGAEILADFKPAIDANGVVGFWDAVNEQFRAPSGAWLSGPLSSDDPFTGQYLEWVYNNEVAAPLGIDCSDDLSVQGLISGDVNHGAFVLGESSTYGLFWRFLNIGDDFITEIGSGNRLTGTYSWDRNGWNAVSVWNDGYQISNQINTGSEETTPATGLPNGPLTIHGWPGQQAWWKHLQVYKGATLCADLYPALLDGVVGMWDKVRETLIHPTDGVWLSGPALT